VGVVANHAMAAAAGVGSTNDGLTTTDFKGVDHG
jgi:hypothetical protein